MKLTRKLINQILNSESAKNYVTMSIKISKYTSKNEIIPTELNKNYKIALNKHREFLDSMGITLPKPRYLCSRDNISLKNYGNLIDNKIIEKQIIYSTYLLTN